MAAPTVLRPDHVIPGEAADTVRQVEELPGLVDEIDVLVARGLAALDAFTGGGYDQDTIDHIVKKAAVAALDQHGQLAQAAVAETGRGVFEDKAVKNIFACEHEAHSMWTLRTVGVISHVAAMKEQLPAQLAVEATPQGPSVIRQGAMLPR